MANRYWVGGTENWNAVVGTKWAATSGGVGGEAVPTALDDVYFDANSGAGTVTIVTTNALCKDLIFTGFTGTLAGSRAMSISGSLTLATGMTRTYTGAITFDATTTGKTITLNGKTTASATTFNGVGGGWTVQDAWDNGDSAVITLTSGSLDTNGQTITTGRLSITGTLTRTLTLGASTVYLRSTATVLSAGNATNLTLNQGTSTIIVDTDTATARTLVCNATSRFGNIRISAGTGTVTLNTVQMNDLDFTGFAGTWATGVINIEGNLTLATGMTVADGGNVTTFSATTTGKTIDTKGIECSRPWTFNGVGGGWTLLGDADTGAVRALTVTNGAFSTGGYALASGSFASTNSNVRTVDISNSVITLGSTGTVWNFATTTNLTFTGTGSTIVMNNASASSKTFAAGGLTYNILRVEGVGAGTFSISGGGTYDDIQIGNAPKTVIFQGGSTFTSRLFTLSGTVGNLNVIQSSSTTNAILTKTGEGVVSVDYVSIADSTAGPGTFYAGANSTDAGGGNVNWVFTAPPSFVSIPDLRLAFIS